MMNIVNGGAHADNPIDFQEFMIMPVGASELRRGASHGRGDLPHAEEGAEADAGHNTNVGDEGGFAPEPADRPKAALDFVMAWRSRRPASSRARTSLLALDCAATEFFKDGAYRL
jgi:enolase